MPPADRSELGRRVGCERVTLGRFGVGGRGTMGRGGWLPTADREAFVGRAAAAWLVRVGGGLAVSIRVAGDGWPRRAWEVTASSSRPAGVGWSCGRRVAS